MKRKLIIAAGSLAALLVLFMSTDPAKVPSFLLIVPFILLFVSLMFIISSFLQYKGYTKNRSLQVAALSTAAPVLLLVLQSIGQLTIRDILTVAILFALSYFYMSRSTASS
jgi:preprotein translocase subunit YajC